MRILRNIIVTLLLMALLVVAAVGVMVEFPSFFGKDMDRVHKLGRSFVEVMRPGNMLFWSWVGLLSAVLLVFLMTVLRPRKQMKIEVQMGGGRVVIMDSAIKRYIRSALAELPGVTVKRIDLRETRLGVSTDIYADVRTHGNLPILQRQMIQRVRAALAEDLGITSIGEVHVFIKDFEVAERASAQPLPGRPQAASNREPESDPQPARTVELTRPSSAEYSKPTASTGPFDQVPMPARIAQEAAAPVNPRPAPEQYEPATTSASFQPYKSKAEPAAPAASPSYFTPTPTGPVAQVTDLGPKDIYAMSEASGTTVDDNFGSGTSSATTAEGTGTPSISDIAATSDRPKKRGIFGLFGGSDTAATSDASTPPANADYNPETATESVDAPAGDPVIASPTDAPISLDHINTQDREKDSPTTT